LLVNIGGFTIEEFALEKGSLLFWKIPRKGKHIQWASNSRLKTFGQTGGLTFDFPFHFSSGVVQLSIFRRDLKHCFKRIIWQILSDLPLWIFVGVGFEKSDPLFLNSSLLTPLRLEEPVAPPVPPALPPRAKRVSRRRFDESRWAWPGLKWMYDRQGSLNYLILRGGQRMQNVG